MHKTLREIVCERPRLATAVFGSLLLAYIYLPFLLTKQVVEHSVFWQAVYNGIFMMPLMAPGFFVLLASSFDKAHRLFGLFGFSDDQTLMLVSLSGVVFWSFVFFLVVRSDFFCKWSFSKGRK